MKFNGIDYEDEGKILYHGDYRSKHEFIRSGALIDYLKDTWSDLIVVEERIKEKGEYNAYIVWGFRRVKTK